LHGDLLNLLDLDTLLEAYDPSCICLVVSLKDEVTFLVLSVISGQKLFKTRIKSFRVDHLFKAINSTRLLWALLGLNPLAETLVPRGHSIRLCPVFRAASTPLQGIVKHEHLKLTLLARIIFVRIVHEDGRLEARLEIFLIQLEVVVHICLLRDEVLHLEVDFDLQSSIG
jgi:hypothetical protein